MSKRYLGDGLYAEFDGFAIVLTAPRADGEHYVVLEPHVLAAFESWVAELRFAAKESAEILNARAKETP